MSLLFDSFFRAIAYCLRPRAMVLSLLPLVILVVLSLVLAHFYWYAALELVQYWLDEFTRSETWSSWAQSVGFGTLKTVLAHLIVIFAVTPLIVVSVILVVAVLMTPALTALVAEMRFPDLERRRGSSVLGSVAWSLFSTLLAIFALSVSIPLWFIPPLGLVLPPLILGWLTYRVIAFDVLAEHASRDERLELISRHRMSLLGMGIFSGYLSAIPSLIWISNGIVTTAFNILIPIAIWIYTLIFALSSLWFAHFCLAALQALRDEHGKAPPTPAQFVSDAMTTDLPTQPPSHEPDKPLPTLT